MNYPALYQQPRACPNVVGSAAPIFTGTSGATLTIETTKGDALEYLSFSPLHTVQTGARKSTRCHFPEHRYTSIAPGYRQLWRELGPNSRRLYPGPGPNLFDDVRGELIDRARAGGCRRYACAPPPRRILPHDRRQPACRALSVVGRGESWRSFGRWSRRRRPVSRPLPVA